MPGKLVVFDTDMDIVQEPILRVYVSYSMADYGSEYMERIFDDLWSIYGYEDVIFIDPSDKMYRDMCVDERVPGGFMTNMLNVFYPMISECDVLVAIQKGGAIGYTPGVINEIEYAKRIGKNVWRY